MKRNDDSVSAVFSHTATPEQYDESFARGQAELPRDPAVQPDPNYARGISDERGPESREQGRFSRGHEQLPEDLPEKRMEGSFSDGAEQASAG